ncbi:M15 family metallopeptidase [Nocardioides sp. LMS-CY]|uniref:M15 family metallopeptidase n=1 Tax=Nocardioides sp. (strain LMS-CY) TaxID=2840457 RepID=UPI00207B0CC1|nr:M15 family metallopeptidase [Nocardioides sp. LMS-CY]
MRSGGARTTGRRRAASLALVLLLAASATACEGSPRADDRPADPATSGSASGTPTPSAVPTLDPAHAVDAPGAREGRWGPPDIIVTSAETIPPDLVARIRALPGVTDVERVARAEIPVENRTLSVLAVDPATYRNYVVSLPSARKQAIWDRVAGGELAIRPAAERELPVDEQGFVALGSTADAPRIHVGAYAQQTWQADAVVNETWVKTLGMTPDNSLLIRTATAAPGPLRKPIERLLRGTDASVQMTDVVAREGLDPDVVQTAVVVGTIADAVGVYRYRVLGAGKIEPDPGWVAEHITTESVPILGSVTCNKLILPQLRAALEEVVSRGLADEIDRDDYAGCYYPRFIAGSTTLSNHAFGLALDLNVSGNQRGTTGEMDRGVVAAFEKWGFTWGGRWRYTDPMHFEMHELVSPR